MHALVGISFFGIEVCKAAERLLGIRLQLHCCLKFIFSLHKIVVQPIESTQHQMIVYAAGIEGDDLFILIDGKLQHFLRLRACLQIAERTQINSAQ